MEVTNTVVVETLIELEVDKVRSYFWSVRCCWGVTLWREVDHLHLVKIEG